MAPLRGSSVSSRRAERPSSARTQSSRSCCCWTRSAQRRLPQLYRRPGLWRSAGRRPEPETWAKAAACPAPAAATGLTTTITSGPAAVFLGLTRPQTTRPSRRVSPWHHGRISKGLQGKDGPGGAARVSGPQALALRVAAIADPSASWHPDSGPGDAQPTRSEALGGDFLVQ